MKRNLFVVTLLVTLAAVIATPAFAARGSADFTRYVAIGDSLTAGYTNGSLVATRQAWSYPAVIARQAGIDDFQQPLISEPGIPPELHLVSLSPLRVEPKSASNGAPINLSLPRPYNNLGIPGARVADMLTLTGAENHPNPFYQIILRGQGTAVNQALALQPTFISVWAGNNDALAAVIAGTPAALTPLDAFTTSYNELINRLTAGAPNAGMVVANIPAVTSLTYARTIPPFLFNPATGQPVPGPDGNPIFFIAELGDGTVGQLRAGSLLTLAASALISTGFGFPEALRPLFPNLPNVGRPLPDAVVLTEAELGVISARVAGFNAVILAAAAAKDIPVVDAAGTFDRFHSGVPFGGVLFNTAYLAGGLISYDGVHPTDLGYTFAANAFIDTINDAYDVKIPAASIFPFYENNAPGLEDSQSGSGFIFETQAWEQLKSILDARYIAPRRIRSRG